MQEVYLDNSATTRPLPEVIDYISKVLSVNYGNPSSLHNKGLAAEKVLKEARNVIANKLVVSPAEIYFTSGGTESNNLAIKGIVYHYQQRGQHLITTNIEHPSVLEAFLSLEEEGFEVTFLAARKDGSISLEELAAAIRPDTTLVSTFHVNSELGAIQPLAEISSIIKEKNRNTYLHVDAVQSFGKLLVKPAAWGIDLLTISAHKIHGPKGIGALYIRRGIEMRPMLLGGGQENGVRSGTENIPGIAGFIPAVKALPDFTDHYDHDKNMDRLKQYFIKNLRTKYPAAVINTPDQGAPHIINTSFPGLKGEVLVHSLEGEGVYVSTGSACHSKSKEKSHVLRAIKLPARNIEGTIRVSLSRFTQQEELDYALDKLIAQIELFF